MRASEWLSMASMGVVVGYFVFGPKYQASQSTVGLPVDRESGLFGRWLSAKGRCEFVFNGDGTGQMRKGHGAWKPFRWGTRGGVLYARYLTAAGWPLVVRPYRFEGASVHLMRPAEERGPFPETLVRR